MAKKLTLRIDEEVIERAKEYAAERGISVSKLVEQYFEALVEEGNEKRSDDWKDDLSPLTRSLLGRAKTDEGGIDEDDYYRYLEEKHQ